MSQKIQFGTLLIIIFSTIMYVQFDDVKIGVHNDYTVLRVYDEGWKISGKEFNRMFDGSKIMNRRTSGIQRSYWNESGYFFIQRKTPYIRGPVIVDTYTFSETTDDKKQVPIEHKVEVYNASGYFYRYTVDQLVNTGPKRKLSGETRLSFGLNTNVDLHPGYRWAWIGWPYGSDSLSAQYKVKSDYEVFYQKLYDPLPVNAILYDKANQDELSDDWTSHGFGFNFNAGLHYQNSPIDGLAGESQKNITSDIQLGFFLEMSNTVVGGTGNAVGGCIGDVASSIRVNNGYCFEDNERDDDAFILRMDGGSQTTIASKLTSNPLTSSFQNVSFTISDSGFINFSVAGVGILSVTDTIHNPNSTWIMSFYGTGGGTNKARASIKQIHYIKENLAFINSSSYNVTDAILNQTVWRTNTSFPVTLNDSFPTVNFRTNATSTNCSCGTLEQTYTEMITEDPNREAETENSQVHNCTLPSTDPVRGNTNFIYISCTTGSVLSEISPSTSGALAVTLLNGPNLTDPVANPKTPTSVQDLNWTNITYTDPQGLTANISMAHYVNGVFQFWDNRTNVANGTVLSSNISESFFEDDDVVVINVSALNSKNKASRMVTGTVTIVFPRNFLGRDWIINTTRNISGNFFNISTVFISNGINITVTSKNISSDTGFLKINASFIFDDGAIWVGDGRGAGGGGGGGGGISPTFSITSSKGTADQLGADGEDGERQVACPTTGGLGAGGDGGNGFLNVLGGKTVSIIIGDNASAVNDSSLSITATFGSGGGGGKGGQSGGTPSCPDKNDNGNGGGGGHGGDGGAYLILVAKHILNSNGTFLFRSGQENGTDGEDGNVFGNAQGGSNTGPNKKRSLEGDGSAGSGGGSNGQDGGRGGFAAGGSAIFAAWQINLSGANITVDGGYNLNGGTIKVLFVNPEFFANATYDTGFSSLVISNFTDPFFTRPNNVSIMRTARITPTPEALRTQDLLGFCNATDDATDRLIYEYTWIRNGVDNFTALTLVNYTQGVEINVNNLSSANTTEGQFWTLRCRANDNATFSEPLTSIATHIVESSNLNISVFINSVKNIDAELGSELNVTITVNDSTQVCADIIHPEFGVNTTCGLNNVTFTLNASFFRKTTTNDSNPSVLLNYTNPPTNLTFFIAAHKFDLVLGLTVNFTAISQNGSLPQDVRIFVNNTLAASPGDQTLPVSLNNFSDGDTGKNLTLATAGTANIGELKIPKLSTVTSGFFNVTGIPSFLNIFMVGGDTGSVVDEVKRYDPESNSWTNLSAFPGGTFQEGLGMAMGDFGYVFQSASWRKYNPRNDTYETKTSFTTTGSTPSSGIVGCNVGSKGYVGMGFISVGVFQNNWSVYNVTDNNWTSLSGIPGRGRSRGIAFCNGDNVYTGAGAIFNVSSGETNRFKDFYKYTVSTDTWAASTDLPLVRSEMSYVVFNGSGYAFGGLSGNTTPGVHELEVYRFNFNNDTWTEMNNLPREISRGNAYTLNNSVYFCGGQNSTSDKHANCIRNTYNPDSWVTLTGNISGGGRRGSAGFVGSTSIATDVQIEVGLSDNNPEFNVTGVYNITNRTSDFSSALNFFLVNCTADANGFCFSPVTITSSQPFTIEIDDIEVNYSQNINPVSLNISVVQSFLDNSIGYVNMPIKIFSNSTGALNITDIRYDFRGGNETLTVLAHTFTYKNNDTANATYFYSRWNFSFPKFTSFMEFIPRTPTSKNVSMFGQTLLKPGINITALQYGTRDFNFSIFLNESDSCVNLSHATVGTVTNKTFFSIASWNSIKVNVSSLDEFGVWFWDDFSCNETNWRLWEPTFGFRACALNTVCSERLS